MDEEEANKVSLCGNGCNVIGGPWIFTNPNCRECNEVAPEELEVQRLVEGVMNMRLDYGKDPYGNMKLSCPCCHKKVVYDYDEWPTETMYTFPHKEDCIYYIAKSLYNPE